MSSARISYAPRTDASPQTEISALANIYKLCLESLARKEATSPGSPDDARKDQE